MANQPKYRRIVQLGHGGMAVVNLAAMRSSHNVTKLVVVKELEPTLAADPEYRAMFLEEARLAARLNHPNVVQTYEILDHVQPTKASASDGLDGVCALVMEYLEGQPLNRVRSRIKADPTALSVYLAVLVDALTGLEYAHGLTDYDGKPLGLVHRDVSPHNIFVCYSGDVKVLDFGIAKANNSGMAPTRVGTIKGKIAYMAPEQARGDRVDGRADVFSFGVILWEAAAGRRLWAGMNDTAILYNLLQGIIPGPRDIKPDVPEALDAICRKALAPDPANRYASAAQMRDAVEQYADTLPSRMPRRAIGDVMVRLFAEERSQVRRIVDEQLGPISAASTDQFESVDIPSSVKLPVSKDSSSSLTDRHAQSGRTGAASSVSVIPPKLRSWGVVAALGAMVCAAAVVAFVMLSRKTHEPEQPATAAVIPPPVAVQAPKSTRRLLAIDPPSAFITVDGKPLPTGTATLEGTSPIALHAEAAGYAPVDTRVSFDTTEPMIVRLSPLPKTTEPVATHPPQRGGGVTKPIPATTTKPAPTSKPTATPTSEVGY